MTDDHRKIIYLASLATLLIAILPLPIGFYTFVRLIVCGAAIVATINLFNKSSSIWIVFGLIAVLYNPIIPVYLNSKLLWVVINLITANFFYYLFSQASISSQSNDN